jgi:cobyrinic acid a,c-diamide synthase
MAFQMNKGEGLDGRRDGLIYKNTLATYTHLHALGSPEWARGLVARAGAYRRKKSGRPRDSV